jgi:hypothetical protein
MNFGVNLRIKGEKWLHILADRLADFSPAFEQIYKSWLAHNVEKFEQAKGAESGGVAFDGGEVAWKGLSEKYQERKRKLGLENWLMVRSGALRASLTEAGSGEAFVAIETQFASFGTINASAAYNWLTRQSVFLDAMDRRSVETEFADYLSGRPPYDRGAGDAKRRIAEIDAAFEIAVMTG